MPDQRFRQIGVAQRKATFSNTLMSVSKAPFEQHAHAPQGVLPRA
jgi:hypothetical protein